MSKLQAWNPTVTWGLRGANGTTGTYAINNANNRLSFGLPVLEAGTINEIQVYASAVAGTLGSSDLVLDVYNQIAGNIGSSLGSTAVVTATPTGAAYVNFTGLDIDVIPGQYYVVIRNANGTPGTNYPTFLYQNAGNGDSFLLGGIAHWGSSVRTSADAGSNYTNVAVNSIPNMRVKWELIIKVWA